MSTIPDGQNLEFRIVFDLNLVQIIKNPDEVEIEFWPFGPKCPKSRTIRI